MTSAIYTERYVAFIDILGFKTIVQNSVSSPEQAEALVKILTKISDRTIPLEFDRMVGDDFRAQSFSDCIVLSEQASQDGLEHLLFVVSSLALDLLSNGILTRGGIAKGKLHHSDKIVLGPAMIAAYQLENTIAEFPRIVVDRAVHRDFEALLLGASRSALPTGLEAKLKFDDDGPLFVDVLANLRDPSVVTTERLLMVGKSCRAAIQNLLNESIYDPRIYKKLRWLAVEWNSMVLGLEEKVDGFEPIDFPSGAQIK